MRYILTLFIVFFGWTSMLYAVEYPLKDVYQEGRANDIFRSLKCEVCEGQSVQDSESAFAKAVRGLVREKISSGLNDQQIYDVLKNNYGNKIMFRPPFEGSTVLLWLLPFVLVFCGFVIVLVVLRKNRKDIVKNQT